MGAAPGWYQDTERPPGHLRYWDGYRWTEHRHTLPAPGAAHPAPASAVTPVVGWMGRHKVATVLLVVLGLALIGSVVPEEDADPAPVSASAAEDTKDDQTRPGPTKSRRDREPAERDTVERPTKAKRGNAQGTDGAGGANEESTAPVAKPKPKPRPPRQPLFLVSRIIDGDTIELGNGEIVRLVGIDTPEVGECGYETAANNLANLVLGKQVRLTTSDEDRDSYGRLLRYVNVGPKDAGLQLIKNGRAIAAYDSRDGYGFHPREPVYVAADRGANHLCPNMATGTTPKPTPKPAAPKPQPLTGGGGSCASGYSPCLPVVADLNCDDVSGPVRVTGSDPYQLDADGDGVGCDS